MDQLEFEELLNLIQNATNRKELRSNDRLKKLEIAP